MPSPKKNEPTEFSKAVIQFILKIPYGKVATYGQIARLAGKPHGARGVAWLLNSSSKKYKLPWQRVVNSQGRISFPVDTASFVRQKKRLEAEGVCFTSASGVDLKRFQWKKGI